MSIAVRSSGDIHVGSFIAVGVANACENSSTKDRANVPLDLGCNVGKIVSTILANGHMALNAVRQGTDKGDGLFGRKVF